RRQLEPAPDDRVLLYSGLDREATLRRIAQCTEQRNPALPDGRGIEQPVLELNLRLDCRRGFSRRERDLLLQAQVAGGWICLLGYGQRLEACPGLCRVAAQQCQPYFHQRALKGLIGRQ